ncbi:MAG: LPS export ABC transporter periplasmic protein LptC, partial [bacterium]
MIYDLRFRNCGFWIFCKLCAFVPLCLCFIFASCGKEKRVISQVSSDITKTVLTSSKGGKKTWRLTSERIRIKDNQTYLYNLKLDLFKDNTLECTITGDNGIITGSQIA